MFLFSPCAAAKSLKTTISTLIALFPFPVPTDGKYPGLAVYQLFVCPWEKPWNLLGREWGGHTWEHLKLSPQKEENCRTEGLDLGIPPLKCRSLVQVSWKSRAEKSRKRCSDASEAGMKNSMSCRAQRTLLSWEAEGVGCAVPIQTFLTTARTGRKGRGAQGRWGFVLLSLFPPLTASSSPFSRCHGPTAPRTNLVPQQQMLFIHFHYICAAFFLIEFLIFSALLFLLQGREIIVLYLSVIAANSH